MLTSKNKTLFNQDKFLEVTEHEKYGTVLPKIRMQMLNQIANQTMLLDMQTHLLK